MNKKFATFMFGIAVAVAAAPAIASCTSICYFQHRSCLATGQAQAVCDAALELCEENC